jgi:hypothetical protein
MIASALERTSRWSAIAVERPAPTNDDPFEISAARSWVGTCNFRRRLPPSSLPAALPAKPLVLILRAVLAFGMKRSSNGNTRPSRSSLECSPSPPTYP